MTPNEAKTHVTQFIRDQQAKTSSLQEKGKEKAGRAIPKILKELASALDTAHAALSISQLVLQTARSGVRSSENVVRFVHRVQNAFATSADLALDAVGAFIEEMPDPDLESILSNLESIKTYTKAFKKEEPKKKEEARRSGTDDAVLN